jgi:hypothetical protein
MYIPTLTALLTCVKHLQKEILDLWKSFIHFISEF